MGVAAQTEPRTVAAMYSRRIARLLPLGCGLTAAHFRVQVHQPQVKPRAHVVDAAGQQLADGGLRHTRALLDPALGEASPDQRLDDLAWLHLHSHRNILPRLYEYANAIESQP